MSNTRMRGLLGLGMFGAAIGALASMMGPAIVPLDALAQARITRGLKRRTVRSFKKTSGHQSKSRGRHNGMIWVGGKWLFFRP